MDVGAIAPHPLPALSPVPSSFPISPGKAPLPPPAGRPPLFQGTALTWHPGSPRSAISSQPQASLLLQEEIQREGHIVARSGPCLGPRLGGGGDASLARGLIIACEPGRQKVFPSSHGFEPCFLAGSGAPPRGGLCTLSPVSNHCVVTL